MVGSINQRRNGRYLFALGAVAGLFVAGVIVPFASDRHDAVTAGVPTGAGRSAGAIESGTTGAGGEVGNDAPVTGGGGTAVVEPGSSSGSGSAATPTTPTPGAATSGPLTATAQGVTATEIRLGVALLDLRTVRQIGLGGALAGTNPEETQRYYRFYIDELNRAGGILGRKVVPAFSSFDPTEPATARRACLALTEDAKVFAAIISPGFFGDPILCFTEEHGVPTMEYAAEPDEWYRRSKGLLFTAGMTGDRLLRSLVLQLDRAGALRGKKIGVVSTDSPTEKLPVDNGLLPALREAGHTVAHRSTISQNTDQQPSQIPVEISQMRRAGVDYVIWASNALVFAQWTQTADGQGYRPPYAMTDINSASNDFTVQNIPTTTKAVTITAIRDGEHHGGKIPEHAKDAGCRQRYEQATKTTLTRGTPAYQTVVNACGWVELFATAAKRAGTNLTPGTFSQAMQGIGPFDFPYFYPGAYRPGKFALADQVRMKTYDGGCKCWLPTGDVQPGSAR